MNAEESDFGLMDATVDQFKALEAKTHEEQKTDSDLESASESESESESDTGSIMSGDVCIRRSTTASIFAGYKKKLEEREANRDGQKKGRRDQGSTLIKGMVDYMRVLEARIGQLETAGRKTTARAERNEEDDDEEEDDDNDSIDVGVKFFHAARHITEDSMYIDVHSGAERGSYMCSCSPRHLIRVLYASTSNDSKRPVVPDPADMDILTFGVSSKPLCAFFEKLLGTRLETNGLIRFEKPFKAVLRHYDAVRGQLEKLEAENTVQSDAPYDRPEALPHFQAFVDFVDKYLGTSLALFRRLRGGPHGYDRVAFENLWMLFDSGDTVYCPVRECKNGTKPLHNSEGEDHLPIRRYTSQAYRVVCTTGGSPYFGTLMKRRTADTRKARNSYSELRVYCFYIDFNGFTYGTVREVFVFRPFEGEVDIRSVLVYPVSYVNDTKLLERGTKFLQLTQVCHQQYVGLTTGPSREDIDSTVIVDMKLAFENDQDMERTHLEAPTFTSPSTLWLGNGSTCARDVLGKAKCSHPWCYARDCNENVYLDVQKKLRSTIESEIKLVLEDNDTVRQRWHEGQKQFRKRMAEKDLTRLLPGAVPGFALRNRRWVLLDIKVLRDVEYSDEWSNLVLPEGHQSMVQAMVETHAQDGQDRAGGKQVGIDLVQGKGKGCIILLHGVPGVGKTSTAECVAAHTKKPLYPITCGDIGYSPEDVERNMETHFKLAHRWGCVLLLDEADVFLARRDQKDVQRNGLVSVFLRILEYYSGILFLTTNRVGAIDDAFRSRLHLTLYYPKLDAKQTLQIFRHHFKRIEDINKERTITGLLPFEYKSDKARILAWVKKHFAVLQWNGRQIRNAFQTVLALAEFDASKHRDEDTGQEQPVVKLRYFKTVGRAALEFNEYLRLTHGYDEDRVARRESNRAEKFVFKDVFTESEPDTESEEEAQTKKKKKKKGKKAKGIQTESDSSDVSD